MKYSEVGEMENPENETASGGNWLTFRSFEADCSSSNARFMPKSPQFMQNRRLICAACLFLVPFVFGLWLSPPEMSWNNSLLGSQPSVNAHEAAHGSSDNITSSSRNITDNDNSSSDDEIASSYNTTSSEDSSSSSDNITSSNDPSSSSYNITSPDNLSSSDIIASYNVTSSNDSSFVQQSNNTSPPQGSMSSGDNLKDVLQEASLPNGTVIITDMNAAWTQNNSMLDLLLESFHNGDGTSYYLNHLIVVAIDEVAYNRCIIVHHLCYKMITEGVDFSSEKLFLTEDYLKIIWRKIDLMKNILELGYNFIFTDGDILWFRDPFRYLHPDMEFQTACDYFNGNPLDVGNNPNSGFMFIKSSNRTINFLKYWISSRPLFPNMLEQHVLNEIKNTQEFANLGVPIYYLDTMLFGGFCTLGKTSIDKTVTMHANCCRSIKAKLADLRVILRDWKNYRSASEPELLHNVPWSPHPACIASWN